MCHSVSFLYKALYLESDLLFVFSVSLRFLFQISVLSFAELRFMAPTYEMPKHHNCSAGREPSYAVQTELWNVPGWGNAAKQLKKKHFQCKKKHVVTSH